jgi:hypothetical protein
MHQSKKALFGLILITFILPFFNSYPAGNGWAQEKAKAPWKGKLTYTKTPHNVPGPKLSYDSYIAISLQPRTYGCRDKEDIKKNLDNVCRLKDEALYPGPLAGEEIKLVTLTEGSIQGMWDEYSDMVRLPIVKMLLLPFLVQRLTG